MLVIRNFIFSSPGQSPSSSLLSGVVHTFYKSSLKTADWILIKLCVIVPMHIVHYCCILNFDQAKNMTAVTKKLNHLSNLKFCSSHDLFVVSFYVCNVNKSDLISPLHSYFLANFQPVKECIGYSNGK